jgi:CheY-like chemotaxis protein
MRGGLAIGSDASYFRALRTVKGVGNNHFYIPIVDKSADKLILIVDDQESDQHMLVRSLQRLGVRNPVLKLGDGLEAVRYFKGDVPYSDRSNYPFPSIVFLDLKLPVVSGWEVLDFVHGLSLKRDSHIFIYSELENVSEVRQVYQLGADSFLGKPVTDLDLMNLIYHFPRHWQINPDGAEKE